MFILQGNKQSVGSESEPGSEAAPKELPGGGRRDQWSEPLSAGQRGHLCYFPVLSPQGATLAALKEWKSTSLGSGAGSQQQGVRRAGSSGGSEEGPSGPSPPFQWLLAPLGGRHTL